MKLFIAPHNDDEALWGAFTLLREKPLVLVVFDSYVQGNRGHAVTADQRRAESTIACWQFDCDVEFLEFRDDDTMASAGEIAEVIDEYGPSEVWAPAFEAGGHPQHNLVATACAKMPRLTSYLSYTTAGKSRGREVPFEPAWIGKKLRALACYESQFDPKLGCWPHFIGRDLLEYYA